jgi:NAD(P)-dependent dehydrogenase (short-subunit alcohol dehydrogenase family)
LENDLINIGDAFTPRIIIVSSESHRNPGEYDWEGFGKYKEYTAGKTVELYGYYKLLLTTFANELSRRLNPSGKLRSSVFVFCPGPVNSNIAREAPILFKPLLKLVFGVFFRSPAIAVQPLIYLASSAEVNEKTIDYMFLMSRKKMDEKTTDEKNGEKLWNISGDLLKNYGFTFEK